MTDEAWSAVCRADELSVGDMRRVDLPGMPPLAVFNIDDRYFVTHDTCTHADASLSDGFLDGEIVECPFHGGRFHVPTGQPAARPVKKPLRTFEVRVADGLVMIRLPEETTEASS